MGRQAETVKMVVRCIWWLLKWTIIISVFVFLMHYYMTNKHYVFNEDHLHTIIKKNNGGTDVKAMYKKIYDEINRQYPGRVLPEKDLQWMFIHSGGWIGSMCILYGSTTEYLMFFGSAVQTAGHSGRYWANITDYVVHGEFISWDEGTFKTKVFKAGEKMPHAMWKASAIQFTGNTWMVEYGRGFIPSTLNLPISSILFGTQDFVTLYKMFKVYFDCMVLDWGNYFATLS